MDRYAHITGWGMAVPERVLSNHDLEQMVDTDDDWIVSRTGVQERRIAARHETTASLAVQAALQALEATSLKSRDISLIIVATSSPEHLFPSTASLVQDMIGANKAGAFDLSAACSGFIFAVNMAAQAIRSGSIDNAVVIGSETLSRLIDWEDRSTCILFGDGAGAFVIQASQNPGGVYSAVMRSDGSGGNLLSVPAGGSLFPTTQDTLDQGMHTIKMNGREVFRFATRVMARATREVVRDAGWDLENVDLIVPHQANIRILESAMRSLRLPPERFMINIQRYGNTSTASIPIAVCEAEEQGKLQIGDKIVLVGFGAGLTWGALAMEWTGAVEEVSPTQKRRWRRLVLLAKIRSRLRQFWRWISGLIWNASVKGQG
jgi:3-oxoacyl-[acyl-carrier-protein] synthase-3